MSSTRNEQHIPQFRTLTIAMLIIFTYATISLSFSSYAIHAYAIHNTSIICENETKMMIDLDVAQWMLLYGSVDCTVSCCCLILIGLAACTNFATIDFWVYFVKCRWTVAIGITYHIYVVVLMTIAMMNFVGNYCIIDVVELHSMYIMLHLIILFKMLTSTCFFCGAGVYYCKRGEVAVDAVTNVVIE